MCVKFTHILSILQLPIFVKNAFWKLAVLLSSGRSITLTLLGPLDGLNLCSKASDACESLNNCILGQWVGGGGSKLWPSPSLDSILFDSVTCGFT
jgi:hypothetical protein